MDRLQTDISDFIGPSSYARVHYKWGTLEPFHVKKTSPKNHKEEPILCELVSKKQTTLSKHKLLHFIFLRKITSLKAVTLQNNPLIGCFKPFQAISFHIPLKTSEKV